MSAIRDPSEAQQDDTDMIINMLDQNPSLSKFFGRCKRTDLEAYADHLAYKASQPVSTHEAQTIAAEVVRTLERQIGTIEDAKAREKLVGELVRIVKPPVS